jgi:Major royal jelly protein
VLLLTTILLLGQFLVSVGQETVRDPDVAGPAIEAIHYYYYDEWPTEIAVSSTGRLFSNYPPGLDPMNQNYTVAELTSDTTETPCPSAEYNSSPGGLYDNSTNPPTSASSPDHLIGVQSVVVDAIDRLWILDTGRAVLPNGTLLASAFGGPKLVGIDLTTDSIITTILFLADVAYPDSYLNDIRFDLRSSLTSSGQVVGYITDSSNEGRNGIVIVDLGTGESWRHLSNLPEGTELLRLRLGRARLLESR